ncbi:MAG: hypothetical protein HY023_12220 [Chloroflexi bacterium]|nr:hypothetical protein [Chloroflexota bacterium]MBI3764221.1 hypothetical protein [Chloroflexota bacterium]
MATVRGAPINEPILVTAKEHGYFPKAFVWRGQRHAVQAVEQCWTTARRHWRGRVEQHCFRVRTAEATFVLSQDLTRDAWRIDQVISRKR